MRSAAAALFVPLPSASAISERISIAVDGATAATFHLRANDGISLPLTGDLLAAMSNGEHAVLIKARGARLGEASLAGSAASLSLRRGAGGPGRAGSPRRIEEAASGLSPAAGTSPWAAAFARSWVCQAPQPALPCSRACSR